MLPQRQTTDGIVGDLDVADVAGAPLRAAVEPAVRDDPGADPRPDLDDDDVVVARRDPDRHSPRASTLTSLSTQTGAP